MINFTYNYLPTTPNNKLFYLVQIIESISSNEKITVIVKNDVQCNEIHSFLKTKCIQSAIITSKDDVVENNKDHNTIYIVSQTHISILEKITFGNIISLYASSSLEELKAKLNILNTQDKYSIIELISKIDFTFIQALYKFSEIQVERYAQKTELNSMQNHIERAAFFIKNSIDNKTDNLFAISSEIKELYESKFNNLFDQNSKADFLEKFFIWSCFSAKLPILDTTESFKRDKNTIKIVISAGTINEISKENITSYFEKLKDITNLVVEDIQENKTTLLIEGRNLKLNNVTHYLESNVFGEALVLTHESIEEIEMPSDNKESKERSDFQGRNNRDRRDNNSRYERRPYSSGGSSYSKRDSGYSRDGGSSYPKRDSGYSRDGGSSYPKRDSGYSRDGGSSYPKRDSSYSRDGGSSYPKRDSSYSRDGSSSYPKRDSSYSRDGGSSYPKRDSGYSRDGGSSYPKRDGDFKPRRTYENNDSQSSYGSNNDKGNQKSYSDSNKSFGYSSDKSYNSSDYTSKYKTNGGSRDNRTGYKKEYQKHEKSSYRSKAKYKSDDANSDE